MSLKNVTVHDIDDHLQMLHDDVRRIRSSGQANQHWAATKLRKLDKLIELLQKVRQDIQMTGMHGRRIDQAALDAAPELKDLNALVLYFDTKESSDAVSQLFQEAFGKRLTKVVQL